MPSINPAPGVSLQGYQKCTMVGHSYGTFVVSVLCREFKDLVDTAVFIDPVCMMLIHPALTYNFVYK